MRFDEFIESTDWAATDLIVMIGLGPNGDRAARLREKTPAGLIVYEPRDEIRARYRLVDKCLVSSTVTSLRARMKYVLEESFGDTYLVNDDSEAKAIARVVGEDAVEEVLDAFAEAERHAVLKHNSAVHTSHKRVAHMLDSLHLLIQFPPINHIAGEFLGKTGVVVGAGPSLDKNIAVLKEHRDKVVIGAVNSSWPALAKAGIEPDFVVICEAKPVGPTIAEMPDLERAIMLPGVHVHPDTWALPWRKIYPVLSNEGTFGEWATRMFHVEPAPIGGSSACLTAGILYILGCSRIVLVGNDCAPSDETGALYSSGAAFAGTQVSFGEGHAVVKSSKAKLAVDDLGGPHKANLAVNSTIVWDWHHEKKIQTLMVYDGLRHFFEEVGETWTRDRRCINATEGGAYIRNWEHLPLSVALEDVEPLDFAPRERIVEAMGAIEPISAELVSKALERQITGAGEVREHARRGISAMREARQHHEDMKASGDDPLAEWTWDRIEEGRQRGEPPIFEVLADKLAAAEAPPDFVNCVKAGRAAQVAIAESGGAADLLDSYIWGPLELARRRGDLGIFGVFQTMFAELERGANEITPLLETARSRINER